MEIGKIVAGCWILLILFFISAGIFNAINSKMNVDKKDIYGNYVIDREMFAGKNANWQYNHFKFKIDEEEFIFYNMNNDGIVIDSIKRKIIFVNGYSSPQLRIFSSDDKSLLIENEPTLYRKSWSFYYVFRSKKYGNMFFKKDNWKKLEN
ncbi:hypothetical protein [Frigoriflavimonas asaccharolytica]|uniref:Uncharacterized protein n=1 Tax=Frigoriflavimonas asaccharolytica TaxID=2735899 RepID=A0A8J8G759_9FLAO|nr:hypothetical protein [Frigoriflavimonas asaccharolytica]NRS92514.1 hypothetical protein [Frigoriflavimonas asaccharolytica]